MRRSRQSRKRTLRQIDSKATEYTKEDECHEPMLRFACPVCFVLQALLRPVGARPGIRAR